MSDDITKVLTERGPGRDLSQRPYNVNVSYAGSGADWFGPQQPMKPIAPPEVAGRALDYVPGYNLTTQPRHQEPVDFQSLRSFAESYDPLRLVIERRKDQMSRLPWVIRVKHEHGRRPKNVALPAAVRERIKDIESFFKKPDYEMSFRSWLRALLEDLFVLDAPSIYCDRDAFGSLIGLRVIDGSTVKRIIDGGGRTPRPVRWTGQPFMWNGATITAENYAALGFKIEGGLIFPPAYQQILHGMPAVSLTTRDMLTVRSICGLDIFTAKAPSK